jgi:uncharacterized protein (TIGR03437 family)
MKIVEWALLLSVCGLGQAQTYSYSTFDPTGSTNTSVNGMNNAGQIVGAYRDAAGVTHNFLRSADGSTYTAVVVPGSQPGTTTTDAINNLGQIAGNYIDASSGLFRSYIRSADGSTFTPFDIPSLGPGGGPKGINDHGVITGSVVAASASAAYGFVRGADGTFTTINMFDAGIRPEAIDNNGDIAGFYIAGGSGGLDHGFLRSPAGAYTTFDLPGTDNGARLVSINNRGQVAGYGVNYNSFAGNADGSFAMLSVLGDQTFAAAINDSGYVAGYYGDGTMLHGFLAVPTTGSTQPAIRSLPAGVISAVAFGGASTIAPGAWIEIYGQNLAPATRQWRTSDFTGNTAPTSLDGVKVSINGSPAYVSYTSPGQVNAFVPGPVAAGSAQVTVTNGSQTGTPFTVAVKTFQPGMLALPHANNPQSQYLGAVFPDFVTYVLPPGYTTLVPTRRAMVGDTIVLFGVGLGPVTPDVPAGQVAAQASNLQTLPQVLFGSVPATVTYAGLMEGAVGLYQINVVVPNIAMPAGQTFNDSVPIYIQVNGVPVMPPLTFASSGPGTYFTLPVGQ